MDEVIKLVAERAGVSPDQAKLAVNVVIEFAKGRMPMIGEQLQAMLSGGGNPLGDIGSKLGGLFGR